MKTSAGVLAAVALVAALGTALLFGPTLGYGFDYDDYHFVHPYSHDDIRAAVHGRWDPSGIEANYYRPLTIAFYAARFAVFGINARAYHALSLGLFALSAAMTGALVWGFTRRRAAAIVATALFVAHPAMPYAQVAWITNQMHLAASTVVLLTLLSWNAVRRRGLGWWLPLLLGGAAAFLIKEDGIMLLPAIVALHWLRRFTVERDLPGPPLVFLALVALTLLGLIELRSEALKRFHHPEWPTLAAAWGNYSVGLQRVFRLIPPDRPWQAVAMWFAQATLVGGVVAAMRATPAARFCLLAGLTIALAFNLPFVLITKSEQMHLVTLGAVITLAGAVLCVADAVRLRGWRPLVYTTAVAGALVCAVVSRDIAGDFAPFSAITLGYDNWVKDWGPVPIELREYLKRKLEPGAAERVPANPADAVASVTFGVHGQETAPDGVRYSWMAGPTAEILARRDAREIAVPLRHEVGAFREPAQVEIAVNGRTVERTTLSDEGWHLIQIALPGEPWRYSRMQRVTIAIDHAWIPAKVLRGSTDNRLLGLQIGTPVVR